MSFDLKNMDLKGDLRLHEPMSNHTSWKTGGNVDYYYIAADKDDLAKFISGLPNSISITWVGLGSNLLVRDGGLSGAVVSVVGLFSLEMSREQIGLRLLSSEAGVDNHRLRLRLYSDAEERRIINAAGVLSELPIYIDDTPLEGIVEIRSKARRLHMENKMDMIIVDYMQLIGGSRRSENRVQEISEISRSLKGVARDLNIPLVAISQLSRAVEQRPSHRPQLSDLRDSGSIEQDADVVMFIHRDDFYYNEDDWDARFPGKQYPKDIAEVIIAKHRHGPIDTINLRFRGPFSRFEDMPVSGDI